MTKNSIISLAVALVFALLLAGCASEPETMSDAASPVPEILKDAEGQSEVAVDNGLKGDVVRVGVISWADLPFQTVKHQAYDYSCGSAAVATLMTYTYDVPTTERAVFEEMFERGDKSKIRVEGFSMLDMSRYLNDHGLQARGYQITQHVIEKYKLPVIALINNNGYNHFVVVKTMDGGHVLVGDPNTGNKVYSREDFAKMWSGVALVVTNEANKAREAYDSTKEWHFARAHVDPRDGNDTSNQTAQLNPMQWQIAPVNASIQQATMAGLVATTTTPPTGP